MNDDTTTYALCAGCGQSALKAFPPEDAPNERGCPQCPPERGPDGIYNAGRLHRGACHAHRTTWVLGSNLFSSWRDETEAGQRERFREIAGYEEVDERPAAA